MKNVSRSASPGSVGEGRAAALPVVGRASCVSRQGTCLMDSQIRVTASAGTGPAGLAVPLSLYVHVPFCPQPAAPEPWHADLLSDDRDARDDGDAAPQLRHRAGRRMLDRRRSAHGGGPRRFPPTRWQWPSGRAACTAISRATARSRTCDLIAALGRLHDREGWRPTYSQNAKTLEEYCDHLDQSRLPVVRGLALARDDLARRAVIMALMYQGQVDRAGMAAGLPSSPRGRSIQAGWRSAAPTAGCRWRA